MLYDPFLPPIYQFKGEFDFLSNFYIEPDGTHVEGEYQAEKCIDDTQAAPIRAMTPTKAKQAGKRVKLIDGWDEMRVDVMRALVITKFLDHPMLIEKLLATGMRQLIEGNTWGDKFWGVTGNGYSEGENWLGKILMEIRRELLA